MRIRLAKRDHVVEVVGPVEDVLITLMLFGVTLERATVCINGDQATANWGMR